MAREALFNMPADTRIVAENALIREALDARLQRDGIDDAEVRNAMIADWTPMTRENGTSLNAQPDTMNTSMTVDRLREEIDNSFGYELIRKLEDSGDFRLLPMEKDLPPYLQHPRGGVSGAYDDATGKTYLVAQWIKPESVRGLVLHEVGVHYGLRRMLGARADVLFRQAGLLAELGNPVALAAARKVPKDTPQEARSEEILARMMGDMAGQKLSVVQRAWSSVKNFLFELGADVEFSGADMLVMVEGCVKRCSEAGGALKPTLFKRFSNVLKRALSRDDNPLPVSRDPVPAYRQETGLVRQVDTPAFKSWFSDSKVVHDDGKPMVVYHGTSADISEFRLSERGSFGAGIYFSPKPEVADLFTPQSGEDGENIMPVYLALKNPYRYYADFDVGEDIDFDSAAVDLVRHAFGRQADAVLKIARDTDGQFGNDLRLALLDKGYDGLIVTYDDRSQEYVAFFPEQIKSAAGNHGDFDASLADIRHFRDSFSGPVTAMPGFKAWFGNSKAVDRSGKPLILYHGSRTPQDLTEFVPGGVASSSRSGDAYGVATYFTTDPAESGADVYTGEGGAVFPVYVRGNILDLSGELSELEQELLTEFANEHLLPSDKARFAIGRTSRQFTDQHDALEFFQTQQANWKAFGDGMARAEPDALMDGDAYRVDYTDFDARIEIKTGDDAFTLLHAVGFDNVPAMGFDGVAMNREGGARWFIMHNPAGNVKSAIGNNGEFNRFNPDIRYSFAGESAVSGDKSRLAEVWAMIKPLTDEIRNRMRDLEDRQYSLTPDEEMEYSGYMDRLDPLFDPEVVRQRTGWFQGFDGRWRFEIPDADARLQVPYDQYWEKCKAKLGEQAAFLDGDSTHKYPRLRLDQVLDHLALFEAYPQLRNVRVFYDPSLSIIGGTYGYFNRTKNEIGLSPWIDDVQALSTLLHETQHAIQFIEGFAIGANSDDFWERSNSVDLFSDAEAKLARVSVLRPDLAATRAAFDRFQTEMATKYNVKFFDDQLRYDDRAERVLHGQMSADESAERSRLLAAYGGLLDGSPEAREFADALVQRHFAMLDQHGRGGVRHTSSREQYLCLAGEIESRAVQTRQTMTQASLAENAPYASEGIASEDVILHFENGTSIVDARKASLRCLERRAAWALQRDPGSYEHCIDGLVNAFSRSRDVLPLLRPAVAGDVRLLGGSPRVGWTVSWSDQNGRETRSEIRPTYREALAVFWESAVPVSDLKFDRDSRLKYPLQADCKTVAPACESLCA